MPQGMTEHVHCRRSDRNHDSTYLLCRCRLYPRNVTGWKFGDKLGSRIYRCTGSEENLQPRRLSRLSRQLVDQDQRGRRLWARRFEWDRKERPLSARPRRSPRMGEGRQSTLSGPHRAALRLRLCELTPLSKAAAGCLPVAATILRTALMD